MRLDRSLFCLLALASAGLASCAGSTSARHGPTGPIPKLTPDTALAAGLTPSQSEAGLTLYTAKCLRCHKPYDPQAYTDSQWQTWMLKMSRKAHLDPSQRELLTRYLQAVRAAPTADTKAK